MSKSGFKLRFYALMLLASISSSVVAPVAFAADLDVFEASGADLSDQLLSEALAVAGSSTTQQEVVDAVASAFGDEQAVLETLLNHLYRLLLLENGQQATVAFSVSSGSPDVAAQGVFSNAVDLQSSTPCSAVEICAQANEDPLDRYPSIQPNGP